ncbi:MAG TPA: alpha-L-arabinofuranosidase A, partial [Fimbriimonas sp.]|nr:alpha-L-arabinofuranosidase A [Fimbriimonas sp.]
LNYVCPHDYGVGDLASAQKRLDEVRRLIRSTRPHRLIQIAVTEWNTTGGDMGLHRAGLWNLGNALACARYQNLLHRNADIVQIANRSNLANSFCSGIIQTDNSRLYKTPTYWAQWLYSNKAGAKPLRIDPPAPLGSGLDVSSTLSENGKVLTTFVVNDSDEPVLKRFDLAPVKGTSSAEAWVLGDRDHADSPDVSNSFDDPDRISVKHREVKANSLRLPIRFEPYSLTVLQFTLTPGDLRKPSGSR